jgi:hypothetical protein
VKAVAGSKAFGVSIVAAAVVVVSAGAALRFVQLGPSTPAPALASSAAVADARARLDRLSAQLDRAQAARPPALPAVPRLPKVTIPARVTLPPGASNAAPEPVVRSVTAVQPKPKGVEVAPTPTTTAAPAPATVTVTTPAVTPTPSGEASDDGGDNGGDDGGNGRGD